MAVTLEKIVPFGRSLDEYRRMVSLSDTDLGGKIVGVGDGPASFNAEMHGLGNIVVSVDPVYQLSAGEIEGQFYAVVDKIIEQVRASQEDWVWSYHRSPDALKEARVEVARNFFEDYERGKREGRYVVGELPCLEFGDRHYDLALCSHLLFLYSDHLNYEFHLAAILEMLRVAAEVRIFPLLTLSLARSPYVERMVGELEDRGMSVEIVEVDYELQRGGNEMMWVRPGVGRLSTG